MRPKLLISTLLVVFTLVLSSSGLSFDQPRLILQSTTSGVNLDANQTQQAESPQQQSGNDTKLTPEVNLGNLSTNQTNATNNCSLTNSTISKLSNQTTQSLYMLIGFIILFASLFYYWWYIGGNHATSRFICDCKINGTYAMLRKSFSVDVMGYINSQKEKIFNTLCDKNKAMLDTLGQNNQDGNQLLDPIIEFPYYKGSEIKFSSGIFYTKDRIFNDDSSQINEDVIKSGSGQQMAVQITIKAVLGKLKASEVKALNPDKFPNAQETQFQGLLVSDPPIADQIPPSPQELLKLKQKQEEEDEKLSDVYFAVWVREHTFDKKWYHFCRTAPLEDNNFKRIDFYFYDKETDRAQYFGRATTSEQIEEFKELFKATNMHYLTYQDDEELLPSDEALTATIDEIVLEKIKEKKKESVQVQSQPRDGPNAPLIGEGGQHSIN